MTDGSEQPEEPEGPSGGGPSGGGARGDDVPRPAPGAIDPTPPEPSGPVAAGSGGPGAEGASPADEAARSGRPEGSTAPPRRRDPLDALAMLRTLREEITAVRTAIKDQAEQAEADRKQVSADREKVNADREKDREKAATDRDNVNYAIGVVSELLPRFATFEQQMVEILARTAPPGPAEDGPDPAEPDTPPITPAIGWDDMDHDTARAAWEALARFVGDVLHGRYRLKRQQVPDCWPLHPRLIRELAWLRSSYLDAAAMEPDLPPASAPWHTRALPPFIANMLDAVDSRECRPGIHRLTDAEATAHITRIVEARRAGEPTPSVTNETSVDRARFVPEAFPTRGTGPDAGGSISGVPTPPTVQTLPDLIAGSCEPRWWLGYYHEASAADLAQRRPTPPRPARPAPRATPPPESRSPASGGPAASEDAAAAGSDPDGSAGAVPSRFDLDNDPDDISAGGPGGTGTGGPGGLGGLDGPAGPL